MTGGSRNDRAATGGSWNGGTATGGETPFDVLTLGETMACLHGSGPLRLGGDLTLSIAGAETNVAIGLARLGHTARWAGVVGADELGALVLRTLRAEAVDTGTVRIDPERPTGLLIQENRIGDVSRVHYYRSGSAGSALGIADVTAALTAGGPPGILHVTGITPALGPGPRAAVEHAVRRAQELGTRVCLDVNHRARLWDAAAASAVLGPLLPYVDVLVASYDELPIVAPGGAGDALAAGVAEVVVKHGSAGAEVWAGGEHVRLPARRVPVASTIGAGDAFVAGYLSGLLDGLSPAGRLERGVTLGAFAVATHGDWHGLPTREELGLLSLAAGDTVR
ncbi:2-dehydro-3-deoxygluconokinase [Streptosporangium becharense]|uniref:2-dehydro-3-deoxygluconokinase n=1 Tax=Streptosporangium becharense TaxID=1816182 RepID=A0A7W9IJP8_9ACTN|nr:sugar kinase [Streptosporangium becharense]MBB2911091.1 2-dehydro-3-deoxygluconokinase [Streptosporangium becharense]MBB5821851.1 2-dehydro-3-deoxygluconokinase [Streptosporangium becharense]